MTFRLRISGDRACFARPEMRRDRVSYDVLTPFAARAIFDSVYLKTGMRWHIDAIHVLNPIERQEFSSDELSSWGIAVPAGRMIGLRNVDYVVKAHISLVDPESDQNNLARHGRMFVKRAHSNTPFRTPFLGTMGFPAQIDLVSDDQLFPIECTANRGLHDLGWMTYDVNEAGRYLEFFRAQMNDGVIVVPQLGSSEIAA